MPVQQGDRRGSYARRSTEPVAEIDIEVTLRGELVGALIHHALRLKREPITLVADMLEKVLRDDLIDAVLDE